MPSRLVIIVTCHLKKVKLIFLGLTKGVVEAFKGKLQSSPDKKKRKLESTKTREKIADPCNLAPIGGRDVPDDFFHMISKTLYAKSEE